MGGEFRIEFGHILLQKNMRAFNFSCAMRKKTHIHRTAQHPHPPPEQSMSGQETKKSRKRSASGKTKSREGSKKQRKRSKRDACEVAKEAFYKKYEVQRRNWQERANKLLNERQQAMFDLEAKCKKLDAAEKAKTVAAMGRKEGAKIPAYQATWFFNYLQDLHNRGEDVQKKAHFTAWNVMSKTDRQKFAVAG